MEISDSHRSLIDLVCAFSNVKSRGLMPRHFLSLDNEQVVQEVIGLGLIEHGSRQARSGFLMDGVVLTDKGREYCGK
jgi:hypothetical protein